MDQPYSRIADALLDYQYWSPNDPQRTPYDDTGWTFPELFNVQAVRVTDVKVLDAPLEKVSEIRAKGAVTAATGSVFLVNHNADTALVDAALPVQGRVDRCRGRAVRGGRHEIRARVVHHQERGAPATCRKRRRELGLRVTAVSTAPSVKTHPLRAARVALLHTWATTQTEGWWRQAFDLAQVPYTYISTQDVAKDDNLNGEVRRHRLSARGPQHRRRS